MGFLKNVRLATAASRLDEEAKYKRVVDELASGVKRDGLWAKALVEAKGSEEMAKAIYLKLRVQSLNDEDELARQIKDESPRPQNFSAQGSPQSEVERSGGLRRGEVEPHQKLQQTKDDKIPFIVWLSILLGVVSVFLMAIYG